jgi:hypothetical protein
MNNDKLSIELVTSAGWVPIPPEMYAEAESLLLQDILRLRFMMACDVGWTGMLFERGGVTWCVYRTRQHIVDVRGA